jgi:hypothetical protein
MEIDTSDFNPPIKLEIEILPEDRGRAQAKNKTLFRVAIHDGTRWKVMDKEFHVTDSIIKINLSKVGDPPIGVSP